MERGGGRMGWEERGGEIEGFGVGGRGKGEWGI